ncbi:MAG: hypothetical protein KHZ87_06840 [Clostridiales bacterium]|nr:hypothetical protein [Clostridiales bacterium]MBS5877710.1 hypothetical protein [Clostridiales bacterium]MDU0939619.1 hypothetical protein [Clostridiales bacterium]MDU1042542.1 hypothetical protein [Clostridiales bacterium]MDU3490020.1 hypothetical protein [Clostridiales bacterium]
MTDKDIMPLSFFKYKGIFTGQQGVMRYLIKKSDKVTDYTAEDMLFVEVWPGPYRSDVVKDELKIARTFPFDDEGRLEAIRWLNEMYEKGSERWSRDTSILINDDMLKDDVYID